MGRCGLLCVGTSLWRHSVPRDGSNMRIQSMAYGSTQAQLNALQSQEIKMLRCVCPQSVGQSLHTAGQECSISSRHFAGQDVVQQQHDGTKKDGSVESSLHPVCRRFTQKHCGTSWFGKYIHYPLVSRSK
eukprot:scpid68822/ scgid32932/ 